MAPRKKTAKKRTTRSLGDKRESIAEQQKLAEAAGYDAIVELGRSVQRCNKLYASAVNEGDTRAALACQKELNRLLGLGPKRGESTGSVSSGEIEAARAQLLPLNLTAKDAPLAELCRLAVAKIVELQTTHGT